MWEKTKQEADNLVASIISAPTRIINKGTGSRVAIMAVSILSSFVVATQSGLEGWAMVGATLAPVLGSGTFVYAKTKQHTDEVKAKAQETVAATQVNGVKPSVAEAAKKTGSAVPVNVSWEEPFNVTTEGLVVGDPYVSWENAQDWLGMLRGGVQINDYKPEIRTDFAIQIYNENLGRWVSAWEWEFEQAKATEKPRQPVRADFVYDWFTPEAEDEFERLIPSSCPKLGYQIANIHTLAAERVKLFELGDALTALRGKDINWDKYRTLNDIRRAGLAAVK